MNKRESAVNKIVGGKSEDQAFVSQELDRQFVTRFKIGVAGHVLEKEKSKELCGAIEAIGRYLNVFLGEYGVMSLDIRPDQVHLVNASELPPAVKGNLLGVKFDEIVEMCGGVYMPQNQWILVFRDESEDRISVAKTIVHESIHFNSFQSVNLSENLETGLPRISTRRMGMVVRSGGFLHFDTLNEAITEELTLRFVRRYFPEMSYTEDEVRKARDHRFFDFDNGTYIGAREMLKGMIDDIFNAHPGQFSDKEEVFRLFVDAMLQGKLLPLARAYEKTYGRGSFEKLADEMQELI